MQMLDFVFIIFFYYYLLLYRVYAVKSIDLYQNYLSEKKKLWCISLSWTVIGIVCLRVLKHKQYFHVYLIMY